MEISPEQTQQLKSWAEQRDEILNEISASRTTNELLKKNNASLAESISEIEQRIISSTAKMTEVDAQEKGYAEIVSKEISDLLPIKSQLQSQISGLEKEVELLATKKDILIESINTLTLAHDKVFNRASVLDKVVEHVTRVNAKNIDDINILISNLNVSIQEMIDKNNSNVAETNNIVGKLPKLFLDLQRKTLIKEEIKE